MINEAFFAKDALVEREVELSDGSKHAIHFRELAAVEFRRFQLSEQSPDDEKRAGSMAALIAASVCDPDGKASMTVAQANRLSPSAANALVAAILEVNGLGQQAKNDLPAGE